LGPGVATSIETHVGAQSSHGLNGIPTIDGFSDDFDVGRCVEHYWWPVSV